MTDTPVLIDESRKAFEKHRNKKFPHARIWITEQDAYEAGWQASRDYYSLKLTEAEAESYIGKAIVSTEKVPISERVIKSLAAAGIIFKEEKMSYIVEQTTKNDNDIVAFEEYISNYPDTIPLYQKVLIQQGWDAALAYRNRDSITEEEAAKIIYLNFDGDRTNPAEAAVKGLSAAGLKFKDYSTEGSNNG